MLVVWKHPDLVSGAGWAVEAATVATVMPPLVDCEPGQGFDFKVLIFDKPESELSPKSSQ